MNLNKVLNTLTGIILSFYIMVIFSSLLTACNGPVAKDEKQAVTASGAEGEAPAALSGLYCVEMSKVQFDQLKAGSPKPKKLIFRFSAVNNTTSSKLFDLAAYPAKSHKEFAENVSPTILKATSNCEGFVSGKRYILGNNEVDIDVLEERVRGVTYTKFLFEPDIDGDDQVRYQISAFNGATRISHSFAPLYTNPSPPAKPILSATD